MSSPLAVDFLFLSMRPSKEGNTAVSPSSVETVTSLKGKAMLFKQLRIQQKAANRRVRDLVRKYVSRLEDLQQNPVPLFVQEYADGSWDYRDAAKIFCHETGCNPESAKRFFWKIQEKAEADAWKMTPRMWMIYFASTPRLPS